MGASASRTSATWLRRMSTSVRLVRASLTATRMRKTGLVLRRYWTNACQSCAMKHSCTPSKERRITRWEHEPILEAVQHRHPEKMRQRRETVEHPFGTLKARMRATHFLMKTLPRVATEMALHVLAYNLTRVINIMGPGPLIAAIKT